MKKFLFVGGTNGNTGPANVNKGIVANLSDAFCIADSVNKIKKYIDAFVGVVRCKVVSATVKLYFSAFVTTRNGFFQSLVFVSIGMLVAEKEKLGKLLV